MPSVCSKTTTRCKLKSFISRSKFKTFVPDGLYLILENGNVIDPQYNAVLRATLEECRRNNMPKETIDRSIKRAVGLLLDCI